MLHLMWLQNEYEIRKYEPRTKITIADENRSKEELLLAAKEYIAGDNVDGERMRLVDSMMNGRAW